MQQRGDDPSSRPGVRPHPVSDLPGLLWGVGAVSQRLGIAPSTLRSWERRYGLGPSARTAGGHRRYAELDVARVERMRQLICAGVPPARAAVVSLRSVGHPAAVLAGSRASSERPAPSRLSEDRVSTTIAEMLHAACDLDSAGLSAALGRAVDSRGVLSAWTDVIVPLLVSLGEAWARGDIGVEVEHIATECVSTELRRRTGDRRTGDRPGRRPTTSPVLLASAPDDQHCLPLTALAAALDEQRISTRVLGAGTPTSALVAAVERVVPRVVFCWSSLDRTGRLADLGQTAVGAAWVLLLGGPGWGRLQVQPIAPVRVERVPDLGAAVERIGGLVA